MSSRIPFTQSASSGLIHRSNHTDWIGCNAFQGCRTLFEVFTRSSDQEYSARPCLGRRTFNSNTWSSEFSFLTYHEIGSIVAAVASGLVGSGILVNENPVENLNATIEPQSCSSHNEKSMEICEVDSCEAKDAIGKSIAASSKFQQALGIMMKNSPNWVILEQACYRMNVVTVPLYDSLKDEDLIFIINQTQLVVVAVQQEIQVEMLRKRICPHCPTLRNIILCNDGANYSDHKDNIFRHGTKTAKGCHQLEIFNDSSSKVKSAEHSSRSNIMSIWILSELQSMGLSALLPPRPPSPQDVATLCYTSGTTGVPKVCANLFKHLLGC